MGTEMKEARTIKIERSVSVWNPELTSLNVAMDLIPMSETVELLNTMNGIRSDNLYRREISKIIEVTIPIG